MHPAVVDLRRSARFLVLGATALDAELHGLATILDEVGPARLAPVAQQACVALHPQLQYPHHGE